MKDITIYDLDYERIDEICEDYDLTVHEVVEILLDNVSGMEDEVFK